jgi:hypothetical protein
MSYFLGYAWIPLLTGLVFLGGLLAMIGVWSAEGHPKYRANESSIAYISDVGAHLKPLFISFLIRFRGGDVDNSHLRYYSARVSFESDCG